MSTGWIYRTNITQEQALFVKKLRVFEKRSWRNIARCYITKFSIQESASTLVGRLLCELARKTLQETTDNSWN